MKSMKILLCISLLFGVTKSHALFGTNMIRHLKKAAKRADAGDKYAFVETVGKSVAQVIKDVPDAQKSEVSFKTWQSIVANESIVGNIVKTALTAELARPEHHLTAKQQTELLQQFNTTLKAAQDRAQKVLKKIL